MQDKTVPQTTTTEPPRQDWIFTFGSGQEHDGKYVVIPGTYDEARAEMIRHFGTAWSFQYGSAGRAGIAEFRLTLLPRSEWPQPIVDRALNALAAFGVTTEREAAQLLPMWLHYAVMTADARTAVYRHFRNGAAR